MECSSSCRINVDHVLCLTGGLPKLAEKALQLAGGMNRLVFVQHRDGSEITGKYDDLTQNNVIGTYAHFHGASGLFNYFIENL